MNGNPIPHHQMGGGDKEAEADRRLRPWHASSSSRIYRVSRATGGKDRHSKVITAKGLRDRRVRLSVPTAIQFYDLQDRLGLDQPSKAVEWLINAASAAISELPSLDPSSFPHPDDAVAEAKNSACSSSASGSSKGSVLYLSQPNAKDGDAGGGGKQGRGGVGGGGSFTELLKPAISTADYFGGEGFLGQMEKTQNHSHQQLQPGCSFLQEHAGRDSGGGGGGLNFSIASSDLLHGLNRGTLQSNLASHFPHGHYHSDHHHLGHLVGVPGVEGSNMPFFVGHAVAAAGGSSQECQFPSGQLYYSNGYWMHSDIKGEGKD